MLRLDTAQAPVDTELLVRQPSLTLIRPQAKEDAADAEFHRLDLQDPLDQTDSPEMMALQAIQERTDRQELLRHHNASNIPVAKSVHKPRLDNPADRDQRDHEETLGHKARLPTEVFADRQDPQDHLEKPVKTDTPERPGNQASPEPSAQSQESQDLQDPPEALDHADLKDRLEAVDNPEAQDHKDQRETMVATEAQENQAVPDKPAHKETKDMEALATTARRHARRPDIRRRYEVIPLSALINFAIFSVSFCFGRKRLLLFVEQRVPTPTLNSLRCQKLSHFLILRPQKGCVLISL